MATWPAPRYLAHRGSGGLLEVPEAFKAEIPQAFPEKIRDCLRGRGGGFGAGATPA